MTSKHELKVGQRVRWVDEGSDGISNYRGIGSRPRTITSPGRRPFVVEGVVTACTGDWTFNARADGAKTVTISLAAGQLEERRTLSRAVEEWLTRRKNVASGEGADIAERIAALKAELATLEDRAVELADVMAEGV